MNLEAIKLNLQSIGITSDMVHYCCDGKIAFNTAMDLIHSALDDSDS